MLTNMHLYHSLSLACIVSFNDIIYWVSDGKVGHFLWHDDDMEFLMLPHYCHFCSSCECVLDFLQKHT